MLPSLPLACQTSALLMSYAPEMKLERVNPDSESGSSRPWHGRILPLNHTRIGKRRARDLDKGKRKCDCFVRVQAI